MRLSSAISLSVRVALSFTFASGQNPLISIIFFSIGLNLYAGDEGAAFQNRKDIIAILAPRSRNEDLYAIGKAKYFFRACAVAQGRIKGAENAQTV